MDKSAMTNLPGYWPVEPSIPNGCGAKPLVEEMVDSSDCVVVGIDDTIQEKPHSRQNELICWHYDHTKGQTIKGMNFLSAVLTTEELAVPIGVEFIRKPECVVDSQGQLKDLYKKESQGCTSPQTLTNKLTDL